jgi:hypothetical protein
MSMVDDWNFERKSMVDDWEFVHDGLKDFSELKTSVADIRDLIFAFCLPDEQQRMEEVNTILRAIERKNRLQSGSLQVRKVAVLTKKEKFDTNKKATG